MSVSRPITLTIAALGGQGGGVVSDWLIDAARRSGYLAQATSVPGVAQRTGATIYYLEFFPVADLPADGRRPIFALMPTPGDVDVVIASEIMEAGRAAQRGLVTGRTTLVTSTHRIYAIHEKSHMADGRSDATDVRQGAREAAKRYVEFDMQALAEASGSHISAVMLGALCGADALPFSADAFVEAIRASGIEAVSSTRGFEAARTAARASAIAPAGAAIPPAAAAPESVTTGKPALPTALESSIRSRLPPQAQATAREGARRMIDYQDVAYARQYLDGVARIAAFEPAGGDNALTDAVARALALWMSFEDTIRVADLKIRSARAKRVMAEVRAGQDQLVEVTEFMKPRVEEICGTLPAGIGGWILRSNAPRRWLSSYTGGRQISTSRISGFLQLYWLAGLRRWRRKSLRFAQEHARIGAWLGMIERTAPQDYALAVEIAGCQQLVKGYGETHERGTANFDAIMGHVREWTQRPDAPARLRALREAALADEQGVALSKALSAA